MTNKKTILLLMLFISIPIFSFASDRLYQNSDFKISLSYPEDWTENENISIIQPREFAVCFSKKGCKVGAFGKKAEVYLQVQSADSFKGFATFPGTFYAPARYGKKIKAGSCELVDRYAVNWGGRKAPFVAMRCKEGHYYRYTSMATLYKGRRAKTDEVMGLTCTELIKEKDKARSYTEYENGLKPVCQKIISTTNF